MSEVLILFGTVVAAAYSETNPIETPADPGGIFREYIEALISQRQT